MKSKNDKTYLKQFIKKCKENETSTVKGQMIKMLLYLMMIVEQMHLPGRLRGPIKKVIWI